MESDGDSRDRQNTRYSTHGIHRYKGKCNPQTSSHLLNITGADTGSRVLEAFCGSGTTLLECAHRGIAATGVDINPLAALISNTKLQALSIDTTDARAIIGLVSEKDWFWATIAMVVIIIVVTGAAIAMI